MKVIKEKYDNILDKLITKRSSPTEFKKAFNLDRDEIKTIIYF
jgi:hypothetical protein